MVGKTETGEELRRMVFGALDFAVTNGYGDAAMHDPVKEVANDLMDYDYDVQNSIEDAADLIPIIEAWRKERAN